jgi:hypothetical protein
MAHIKPPYRLVTKTDLVNVALASRREALEEAAQSCERQDDSEMAAYGRAFAAINRAMK